MSEHSSIEWTDATWNPIRGCTKISPGCTHCYAETFAERFRGVPGQLAYQYCLTSQDLLAFLSGYSPESPMWLDYQAGENDYQLAPMRVGDALAYLRSGPDQD